MATRTVLLDRTRIPGRSADLLQLLHRRACTTSQLRDDPAAGPPAGTADWLGHVIVGALVNDDRQSVLVEKPRHLPPETQTRVAGNFALALPSTRTYRAASTWATSTGSIYGSSQCRVTVDQRSISWSILGSPMSS